MAIYSYSSHHSQATRSSGRVQAAPTADRRSATIHRQYCPPPPGFAPPPPSVTIEPSPPAPHRPPFWGFIGRTHATRSKLYRVRGQI